MIIEDTDDDTDDMLVDYRVRCGVMVTLSDGTAYEVIRYGVTSEDMCGFWYDLPAPYAQLSRGGRRPGNPIEMEKSRHYFNKRIMTDEERQEGQARTVAAKYGPRVLGCGVVVQGGGDAGSVVACDGAGGDGGAGTTEADDGSAGSGGRGPHRDEDEIHEPEVES
jgi:hypothetical protein